MIPFILLLLLLAVLGSAWLSRRDSLPGPRSRDLRAPNPPVPWYASRGRAGTIVLALIVLIALLLILANLGVFNPRATAPAGEFVVRVAPFSSSGEDQRQGAIVAEQLIARFKERVTTPMNVGVLPAPLASPGEALELARSNNVDVIIWGDVAPGATADQVGLRPRLLWLPNAPFEPRTWQGFDGHFAIPADYDLAQSDLNGSVVLPPLLDALNHFARGDADRAATLLATLRRDYGDVLRLELPAMLQTMIAWAEGRLPDAEVTARDAVASTARPEHLNNLGAILLDLEQLDAAQSTLTDALAGNPDLVAAHNNLGRVFLNRGDPAGALPNLRSAGNLAPSSPAIIGSLGEAYRRSGQLGQARAAMDVVLSLDPDNAPAIAEQSMLALTPVTTTERLEWELYAPPPLTAEQYAELRSRTETSVSGIETLRNEYLRRANAYGVAGRPEMQRLAETQAAILEQELLNRRYQLMLVQIEQGRVLAAQPRSGVRRFWDSLIGSDTPLTEAIANANDALKQQASAGLQYDFHYQRGRAAALSNNPRLARSEYDAAQGIADSASEGSRLRSRPEAHYGRARLLGEEGQPAEARAALEAALQADDRFFPAREQLASVAASEGRWADATDHYRRLAQQQPWKIAYRLKLAEALQAQGNHVEAEAELLPLANAGDPDALVQLAALYRSAGRLDEASDLLDRVLADYPNLPSAHEEAANIALARGQPEIAESELRQALQSDASRLSARVTLARLYADRGDPAAAAEQFRIAVENRSVDPLVHRQLGEVLLQTGNPQAAEESFKRALELAPNSHEAHHGLAMAYLAQSQYADAAEEEARALEIASGNYTLAIVGQGDIELAQGRYDQAIQRYSLALERDDRLSAAYLGLGRATQAKGQTALAIDYYRQGLAIEPNNVPLLLALGDAYLQQPNIAEAQATYIRARELAPTNAAVNAGLGRTLWQAGETEAALQALDQATQLNPADAETWLLLGDINDQLDQPTAALDAYTRAIEARDNWYQPYFGRGVLHLKLQQTDEAIDDLQTSVRLNRDYAQGHYWLGRAHRAAGDFGNARRALERAVQLNGNYYEARYFLGRTLDELGQAPDAIATYQAIIAEAPDGDQWRTEAQRELDRIQ
jgi:tetratricopeptide (TPR) repeat protein